MKILHACRRRIGHMHADQDLVNKVRYKYMKSFNSAAQQLA